MARRVVLDVSNWQGEINFAAIKAAHPEVAGAIIKASEGGWEFTNPDYEQQLDSATSAGLAIGAYTYTHPADPVGADAHAFLARLAGHPLGLGAWLDAEDTDGLGPAVILPRLLSIAQTIRATYPMRTGFYTGTPWWDENTLGSAAAGMDAWPLWIAAYTNGFPALPIPWRSAILWQFTDKYPARPGGVDASIFLGSDEQWEWMTTGHLPRPLTPVPFPFKTELVQIAVHARATGVFDVDTDRRVMGIRAMRNIAGRRDPAQVRYAQQVMAFPGASANGVWDRNSQQHTIATIKAIQAGLGCPQTGTWDADTEFAFVVLDPHR